MNKIVDQNYLKNFQYKTSGNLQARVQIHQRFSTNAYGWYRWEYENLQIQPGERILDIGCGPAELWKSQIARLPEMAQLVLCDLSQGMAAAAKSAIPGENVTCCVGDAQQIPFESESFDLVTANHMLYHVPDIQRAVSEFWRVMRPGGRLVAATNGLAHMRELYDLIRSLVPGYMPASDSAARFGLENGQAQLSTFFPEAQMLIYEDALWVTEVEPLVNYIASMWGFANWDEIFRQEVTERVKTRIITEGGFRIQKSGGVIFGTKMMRAANKPEFPVRLRLLLPLLAAVVFALAPRAYGIEKLLAGSTLAQGIGLPASAVEVQLDLLKWEPWRIELWQPAGKLAVMGGNLDLAVTNLEQARALGSLTEPGQQLLGDVYWIRQEKEKAVATWKPLMQAGLVSTDAYQRVVQYRRSLGNLEEAAWYAQLWQQFSPADWRAAWNVGLLSLPGDWVLAREELTLAAKLEPAQAFSVQILLQAIQANAAPIPDEYRLVQIGRALGSLGEWDLALAAFERAKNINPIFSEAWAYNSEALQRLHRDGQADLNRALQLTPDSAAIQALAGLNDRRNGDLEEALQHFIRAAELEPLRAAWQIEIGNSYADLHNLQKGQEYYQKAVDLDPGDPVVWRYLAQYNLTHDFALRETGLPAARQAVTLAGDDPANLDLIGQVLLALEDETSGERFLQQAIQKSDVFPEAYFHLGQLYLRQAKMDWAEYYLAQAVRMSERSPEIGGVAQRLLARYFGGR